MTKGKKVDKTEKAALDLLAALHRWVAATKSGPSLNVNDAIRTLEEKLGVAHCHVCGEMHSCTRKVAK